MSSRVSGVDKEEEEEEEASSSPPKQIMHSTSILEHAPGIASSLGT
jgi:hypothetical protein